MTGLAILLAAAAAAHALALRLRLPSVPVLIACGCVLSLSPWAPTREISGGILEFGLAFLVFTAGIELSPRRFASKAAAVTWVALVQFLAVGLAGFFTVRMLGYSDVAALYMGFAVSASSTLVAIRHLRAQQQMFEPFGRLVTGVLLFQDVAVIFLLVALAAGAGGATHVSIALGKILALGLVAAACHVWLFPRLTRRLRSDDETLLLVGLATLFAFGGAAMLLGLPLIAGAFLAGFALASFPGNGLLRGLLGSLSDVFHALFFTALGGLITLSHPSALLHALALALLVFLVTPPIVAFVAEWRGLNARSGIESGLLLAQTSELGIVLALAGLHAGHIDQSEVGLVALVAAITMTLTPLVANDRVTWALMRRHPSRQRPIASLALRDHILMLGFGSAGMWAVKPLLAAGYNVLVVDEDPAVVEGLSQARVSWWRGDASDEQTLDATRARDARLIIAALPRVADMVKVIRYAHGVPVVARVFENNEAQQIERAGGTAILNSRAAADQFLAWFENFQGSAQGSRPSQSGAA